MNINHITIKESHDNDIISYSVTVYYESMVKVTYEFTADSAKDILDQAEAIIPEAIADYMYQYQIERHTENDTIITEYSESIHEKRIEEDMGITHKESRT